MYITIQQMAEKYNVTKQTIRNWIKQGLPHIKLGNVLRFEEKESDSWIRNKSN